MLLYKFIKKSTNRVRYIDYKIEIFKPMVGNLQQHSKFSIIHYLWFIFTFGKYRIVYIYDNDKIIHYSHILPRFWKLSFLEENDLEIGPCWTHEDYRCQGIYSFAINYIIDNYQNNYKNFFMIVDEHNKISIKGIKNAGFILVGNVKKSKISGIYYEA